MRLARKTIKINSGKTGETGKYAPFKYSTFVGVVAELSRRGIHYNLNLTHTVCGYNIHVNTNNKTVSFTKRLD